jgi:hypothetical protein
VSANFLSSNRTYGAGRVWHDLLAEGARCGLHRIEAIDAALWRVACAAYAGSASPICESTKSENISVTKYQELFLRPDCPSETQMSLRVGRATRFSKESPPQLFR